ncbi:putative fatty acyl-CoA reductase CG5065 [Trichogramma pretiosum]|uniref:putative fatty acyl-CoA reductase CG5065 n=1 Tax=Trichogramma pretiosum TaxID=7493 RepID=UPI0006C9D9A3|nr:putative fatty acyl-CoA reductase CG5065 [Trichogramma pretiosum]
MDVTETSNKKLPSIPEWYRGREVLVTGGTGFMGKCLVAKLLLDCPEVEKIYLIVREKKGVLAKNRLAPLIQQEPFRQIREKYSSRLKKLCVVAGDTTLDGLGMSQADAELIKNNVSVIINMAANVRFDQPLKNAVTMNTKGTMNVIAFAKQVKNLESFVHVSTAYCHCNVPELEERFYSLEMSPEEVIKIVDQTSDDVLETMTAKLLGEQPNTYAFTKALSEDLVRRSGLPAAVARPSIVSGSYKEPDYGWVDNMNGPTGLMVGAGKGVIRTMLCKTSCTIDVIPCDMAVNATIALAWQTGLEKPKIPTVMNLTSSGENPITWKYALDTGRKHVLANPFSGPLWYPGGGMTSSKLLHIISVFFLHTIPAYFLDALIMLTGNKPFLVKVQARVTYGINLVYYYTTKEWVFKNDRLKALRESILPEDKEKFFMDINVISWDDYMLKYILATRKYCLKDDPSTLPRARRVFAYLYTIDLFAKICFVFLIGWFLYSWIVSEKMTIAAKPDMAWT